MNKPPRRPGRPQPAPAPRHARQPARSAGSGLGVALIGLGLLTRLLLASVSLGTNDTFTFLHFGAEIRHAGLSATYRADPDLNHPPIPACWAWLVFRLTASNPLAFAFVFKLPAILADAATVWLIWRILRPRLGAPAALTGAALYAWSLDAILVSGYHCNTDPVYAFLMLLCVYLVQDRRRPFLAGLALAAAVNVKLTPLLLVPIILLHRVAGDAGVAPTGEPMNRAARQPGRPGDAGVAPAGEPMNRAARQPGRPGDAGVARTPDAGDPPGWHDAARFLAGLSLGVVPFLPILLGPADLRAGFRNNALAYKSNLDKWGISFFLLPAGDNLAPNLPAGTPAFVYYSFARYLILAAVGAWAVAARWLGRWNLYESAAVTLGLFLVLTAGFGVQYTVILLPLLVVIRPRLANVYGTAAGLFLAAVYFIDWTGDFPLWSHFHTSFFPMPSPYLGLIAWGTLIVFIIRAVTHPARRGAPPVPDAAGETPGFGESPG